LWYSDRVFSEYVGFAILVIIPHDPHVFIYTVLLQEGQTGEAWDPAKKRRSFSRRLALNIKVLALLRKK
jgi:hypothetical protein